jgi:lantibiotic biosynthesis protein
MPQFPYQFFEEYIVRTPLFSYKDLQKKLSREEISDDELKEICNNPVFQEAIYLASPYLHEEIRQWLSRKDFSLKEYQKLKNTILKYYSRISTRCTPFGLFSFVHLGNFDNEKAIDDNLNNIRDTKLDMHFLVSLAKSFEKIPKLKNQLRFFPNNSIYQIRDNIRYVEYEYNSGKRNYFISSAPFSDELQRVLDFSEEGKTITQIVKILINEEITENEAIEFVDELIENQVLVSEIEPNVSGKDFLDTLIAVLNRINAKGETEILFSIKTKLNKIDQQLGNSVLLYSEIEDLIKSFEINYEKKFLFQTDLYSGDFFTLSPNWKKKLKEGISFLNKISLLQKDTQFEKFKKAFNERFETQEMPLAYVLDAEVGIGYKQNVQAKGVHHYLEDVKLPVSAKNQALTIEFSRVHVVLNEKLQMALQKNKTIIELLDDDFKDFEEKWNDLPDTISFMAEIISENNQEKLFINGSTGSSAASLLGRFCSEKAEVQNLTKIITSKEEELNQDYILGEIIHLPHARIGNVIRRPTLRKYEIPYLAQSVLPKENQISIDDLFISLKNDKIILRSKKLNKKIKPYLTNAHNYFSGTLPVYHFLADFHSQNARSGLSFDWGGLEHIYQFLPRVEYNNIILSKAQWKITHKDLDFLEQLILDKKQLLSKLNDWRNERNIPAWIQWVKSDNKLTINLENLDTVKMFIDSVKSEKSIIIEEFLYNENDDFKREFIFPMYKLK